ncbi:MAG: TlpA family protein disulfide reductase [Planctomycetota bacterium]
MTTAFARILLAGCLLAACLSTTARAAFSKYGEAEVGKSPPGVKVDKVLMGPSPKTFTKGNVLIVDFWNPDNIDELDEDQIDLLEALAELQVAYEGKIHILTFINEIEYKVRAFHKHVGRDVVNFTIVEDERKWTRRIWCGMRADLFEEGDTHILYVVDRDQKISYTGRLRNEEDVEALAEAIAKALGARADAEKLAVGSKAPALEGKPLQGKPFDPGAKGISLLHTFGASAADWRSEESASVFRDLHAKYGKSVRFLAVSEDPEDDIRAYMAKNGIDYPVFQLSEKSKTLWMYGQELPVTYLLRDGEVVWVGRAAEGVQEALEPLASSAAAGAGEGEKTPAAPDATGDPQNADPEERHGGFEEAGGQRRSSEPRRFANGETVAERRARLRKKVDRLLGE